MTSLVSIDVHDIRMSGECLRRFCEILYKAAGIRLSEKKKALLVNRVVKRMRALRIDSPEMYLVYLERDRSGDELSQFLDVMTTNFTSFNREAVHFELLGKMVSTAIAAGRRRFRFWSAACSSGEEPYSMAMAILDAARGTNIDVRILATDLSNQMLSKARTGRYSRTIVDKIPPALRQRYLARAPGSDQYEVIPELRRLVLFKNMNLSSVPFPIQANSMDIVFCRNVMIYFDLPIRQTLVGEIQRIVVPGGLLLTGHTESLAGLKTEFKVQRPSVYTVKS